MKRLSLIIAAAAVVGFAGGAIAQDHEPPGKAHGVYGCEGPGPGLEFKNPGKAMQFARDEFGFNPKEAAEFGGYDNPGEAIADNCGNPDFEPGNPE